MALPIPDGATTAGSIRLSTVLVGAVQCHVGMIFHVVVDAPPILALVALANGRRGVVDLLPAESLHVKVAEPDALLEGGGSGGVLGRDGSGVAKGGEAENGVENGGGLEHHFDGCG